MIAEKSKPSHIGVGLYSYADAARIVGAHPSRIYRWLKDDTDLAPMVFDRTEQIVTFQQLMELHFIKIFRDAGVKLKTIRRASIAAAKKYHTDYPFSVKRFDTDGHRIFATLIDEGGRKNVLEELQHGRLVFGNICKPFFKKLDYRAMDETVIRFWPRGKRGRVVLDPLRKFGKPIDSDTGVSTRAIYDAVTAGRRGQGQAVVARWLGVPTAAVKAAYEFEESLLA